MRLNRRLLVDYSSIKSLDDLIGLPDKR